MPWQSQVADVALEVDDRGRFAHPLVVISVPRQAGKTTLVLANAVHRCLAGPRRKAWHTAQTGQDARTRWLEMSESLLRSPLRSLATIKRGAGDSRLLFANGSQLRPHPPTIDALHGEQSDLNDVDEAWHFTPTQGANLMQAIVPTQATRPGAQTIILSTMGTADSTWFHDLCDRGRDGEAGIAYFEWSIPDDVDPLDLDAVAAAHPAYGHTIDMDTLRRAAAQLPPGEFARAFGNRRTLAAERLIDPTRFGDCQTDAPIPDSARPAFGAAVSIDRSETAIVAAALVDGVPLVEVIDCRPGTSWAGPRLQQLSASHLNIGLAIDRNGPSATLADSVVVAGLDVLPIGTREMTTAAANLLDLIDPPGDTVAAGIGPIGATPLIRFRTDPAFDLAVDVVTKRAVGDAFAFARLGSGGASIAVLEAASLAVYALLHQPPPSLAPKVWMQQ